MHDEKNGIRPTKHATFLEEPDISIIEDSNGGTSTDPTPVAVEINNLRTL